MDQEEFQEVETDYDYGYEEDFTASDFFLLAFVVIVVGLFVAFVCNQLKGTFKHLKFNIGDKVNIELETKEDKECQKKQKKKDL